MTKTITIKTTEITWRHIMESIYTVIVITDGKKEWAKNFDNALEAVNCYNSFVDHGFCLDERVISLVEPGGKFHSKIFRYPVGTAVH
jgi:hypothetical protein